MWRYVTVCIRDFEERLPEAIAERGLLEWQFPFHKPELMQTSDSMTLKTEQHCFPTIPSYGAADA